MHGAQESLLGSSADQLDRRFKRSSSRSRRFIGKRGAAYIFTLLVALTLAVPASATGLLVANIVNSSCTNTGNKLRYDCSFETDIATRVTVEWDDGTTVRSTPPSALGLTHNFRLVGMRGGVWVQWRAWTDSNPMSLGSIATGSFTTQPLLGSERAALTIVPAVGGYSLQSVLFPADCGGPLAPANQMLFIADAAGGVVWYEDPSPRTGGGQIGALNLTEYGTILAIHGEDIVEYTLEGDLVTHLEKGVDFTDTVHHDVFRRGNHLFALSSVVVAIGGGVTQQYDGVMVFDASGLVEEWDSSGLYDASTECYATNDCMHTNALWVGRDGSWTMSQRTPGRVIQIDGDPFSTTYGQIVWELDGQGLNDYFEIKSVVTADKTFEGQHNVQFLPNGKLLMFDNEFSPTIPGGTGTSRGLEIRLVGSTALITHEYTTGMPGAICSSRGSAFKIDGPDGNVLTTCADNNTLQEIDSAGAILWEANPSCTGPAIAGQPYRSIPIELP